MINSIKTHKLRYGILLGIILLVIGGIIFFVTRKNGSDNASKKNVQNTLVLSRQTLSESISATGTVESAKSKTISANVNGLEIQSVKVKAGDKVTKGQTILTFDQSDLKENLTDAEENLSEVKSQNAQNISSAQTALSDARSNYAYEKAKADKNVKQTKAAVSDSKKMIASLKKQIEKAGTQEKVALQESLTKAQESLKQAQESYENAKASRESSNRQNQSQITQAKSSLENTKSTAEKNLKEAKKQKEQAKEALSDAKVTAPMDGVVTVLNVEEGDTYTGGALMQIDDISSFTVTTTVDEYDISNVEVGQKVVILTEATDEQEINGEITFVAPSTSSSNMENASSGMENSSSTEGYEVKINITDVVDNLRMGLTAKCSIILKQAENVFAVPYDAIHKNENREDVIYVAKEESNPSDYSEILVTKGMESDYYVEISGDDLEEGMSVLIPTDETEASTESSQESMSPFNMGGGNMGGVPGGNMGAPNGNAGGGRGNKNNFGNN